MFFTGRFNGCNGAEGFRKPGHDQPLALADKTNTLVRLRNHFDFVTDKLGLKCGPARQCQLLTKGAWKNNAPRRIHADGCAHG